MALTPSIMRDLGTLAPDFSLPTPDGKIVSRRDHVGKPMLIMFICNHCPFVRHLRASPGSAKNIRSANRHRRHQL